MTWTVGQRVAITSRYVPDGGSLDDAKHETERLAEAKREAEKMAGVVHDAPAEPKGARSGSGGTLAAPDYESAPGGSFAGDS